MIMLLYDFGSNGGWILCGAAKERGVVPPKDSPDSEPEAISRKRDCGITTEHMPKADCNGRTSKAFEREDPRHAPERVACCRKLGTSWL
jgi:hypothetical protein